MLIIITLCVSSLSYSQIFQDDFSGVLTDNWELYGEPLPVIRSGFGNPAPSFDNFGNGVYDSYAISKQKFDLSQGLVIECDIYVSSGDQHHEGFIGIVRDESYGDGPWPYSIAGIDYRSQINLSSLLYVDSELRFYTQYHPDSVDLEFISTKPDPNLDGWHNYKIVIKPDKYVDYIIDDVVVYSSSRKIHDSYNNLPIVIGRRSSGGDQVYHDNLKVYDYLDYGLVAYYSFNGDANDESGNGHNGTENGGIARHEDRFGTTDGAFNFDGVDDFVRIPHSNDFHTNSMAFSGWVNLTALPSTYSYIYSKKGATADPPYDPVMLYINDVGILTAGLWGDNDSKHILLQTSIPIELGSWTHIYISYDASSGDAVLYINGELVDSGNELFTLSSNTMDPVIGAQLRNNGTVQDGYYNGQIDDIRIFSRVLLESEIDALYTERGWSSLDQGLVAYYPFNGNANDDSGNGYNGSENGDVALSSDRNGLANEAYEFIDSNNSRISLGTAIDVANLSEVSVSAWVKLDQTSLPSGDGNHQTILGQGNSTGSASQYPFWLWIPGGSSSLALSRNGTTYYSTASLTTNWHQVVLTIDDTNLARFYVDGIEVDNGSVAVPGGALYNLAIGNLGDYIDVKGNTFNGKIDDLRIYSRDLSATEVTELYEIERPQISQGLVAYYPFNGNANDESGNSNNGTENGGISLTMDRFGNSDAAYIFDGSDDFILTAANNVFDNHQVGSMSSWFKLNETTSSQIIVTYSTDESNDSFYNIRIQNSRLVVSLKYGGSLVPELTGTTTIEPNKWYQIIVTSDNSNRVKAYINGQEETFTFDDRGSAANGSEWFADVSNVGSFNHFLSIGAFRRQTQPYTNMANGIIDDLRLYDRTLSGSEVLALYELERPQPTNDLVAYYPFNGNANDESGNGNDGTENGGVSSATDRFGNADAAFNFDGVDDYIALPSTQLPVGASPWTITGWVSPKSLGTVEETIIQWGSIGTRQLVRFGTDQTDDLYGPVFYNDDHHSYDLPENTWSSFSITYDGNTQVIFYVNGEIIETITLGQALDIQLGGYPEAIGSGGNPLNHFFNGLIDDIRIYSRTLSTNEITDLYQLERPQLTDGLVAYYPFNGNTNDESGNGFNGTESGAVTLTTDRFGNADAAYEFDGVDDVIDLPDFLGIVDGATFSFWMNPANISSDQAILRNWIGEKEIRIHLNGTNLEFSASTDGTIEAGGIIANVTQANKWYHCTAVYDGFQLSFYVDGEVSPTVFGLTGALHDAPTAYRIGARDDISGGFFDGVLDDFRIYNRALGATEVQQLYSENGWGTSVTDIDGNTYSTVQIGTQTWMGENLKTTQYNDGTAITLVTDNTTWANQTTEAYSWYNNDQATYGDTYGGLYNWYAVETGKLCPSGWHVPSSADWNALVGYLGGGSVAGGKLKETGTVHWNSPNAGATNESGFTALPAGYRNYTTGAFEVMRSIGIIWSSSEVDADRASIRQMLFDVADIYALNGYKNQGFSVRCLKSAPSSETDFLTFSLPEQTFPATIDAVNHTIYVKVTYNTDVTALIPTFTLSTGAAAEIAGTQQTSGTTGNDYTSSVIYRIMAEDGTTFQDWTVEVVVDDGLLAYYPFTGNADDASGNDYHGTISGASPTSDRFGTPDDAYLFDGSTNYIDFPAPVELLNTAVSGFSFSAWIYSQGGDGTTPQNLFEATTATAGVNNEVYFEANMPAPMRFGITDDSNGEHMVASQPLNLNTWYYVVGTYDGAEQKIYIDGQLVASEAWTNTFTINSNIQVGKDLQGGQYFNGIIDDIRIYNRAISQAEVTDLFTEGGWSSLNSGLVAYYPFNGNANDESFYGNNGTENGGVALTTDRFGNADAAYSFDGVDDYIRVANNTSINPTSVSLNVWISINSISGEYDYILANKGSSGDPPEDPYQIRITPMSEIEVWFETSGNSQFVGLKSAPLATDEWYMVSATFDESGSVTLYLNGNQIGSDVAGFALPENSIDLGIGVQFHSSNVPASASDYFAGHIDDIRIYNRVLSVLEIEALYNEGGWNPSQSSENEILTFTIPEQVGLTSINNFEHTVSLEVINGSDLTTLQPLIELSPGATVSPLSLAAQDFTTNPVTYTVTAEDGTTTQDWEVTVNVNNAIETGTLSDIDGNVYKTVKIGYQWWMAENLRTAQYSDGTALVDGTTAGVITDDYTTKYRFSVGDNSANDIVYGSLYTWAAAMNGSNMSMAQGACPTGWHVPSDLEWQELEKHLGMADNELETVGDRGTVEGGMLKEVGQSSWQSTNVGATNEFGFRVIPAGQRDTDGSFNGKGGETGIWNSNQISPNQAWARHFSASSSQIARGAPELDIGLSVRCTKDRSSEKVITSLSHPELVSGSLDIDNVNQTVNAVVNYGTDLATLAPTISISDFASIDPTSGSGQDFTSSVVYTVTAEDRSTQDWTVSITVELDNEAPVLSNPNLPTVYDANLASLSASVTILDNLELESVSFMSKWPYQDTYTEDNVVGDAQNVFTVTLNKSLISDATMQYYFRAEDASGNKDSTALTQIALDYDETSSPPLPLASGGDYDDWRMFSIPHVLDDKSIAAVLENRISKYNKKDWRIVHYDHNESPKFLDYGDGDLTTIERGKGYWFNSRQRVDLRVGASTSPQHDRNNMFEMNLVAGWNQIGNPYTIDVLWQDVLDENGITGEDLEPLKVYNGGKELSPETVLEKFAGAYVHSDQNRSIWIPLKQYTGGRLATKEEFEEGWFASFQLATGEVGNSYSGIGMHPDAREEHDGLDRIRVPRFIKYIDASFSHPEYHSPSFARDIVEEQAAYTWEFTVNSNIEGESRKLSWTIVNQDDLIGLVLLDLSNGNIIDMMITSSYSYIDEDISAGRKFRAIYGDEKYLIEQLEDNSISLGENYPNPFTGKTIIPYSIYGAEGEYQYEIKIYSIEGKVVNTLLSETKPTGSYQVEWDGRDNSGKLLNGLFIYSLEVNTPEGMKSFRNKLIVR